VGGHVSKIVQVVPKLKAKSKLKALLKDKERELRGSRTTLYRDGEGWWKHKTYPGWIKWDEAAGGLLIAEIKTKKSGAEWQLLQAFIGYLDRHLGQNIESISIHYR
jgi:hypothetical protein